MFGPLPTGQIYTNLYFLDICGVDESMSKVTLVLEGDEHFYPS